MLRLKTRPRGETAFVLMVEQAIITEIHAAEMTIKILAMKNFISTFATFDCSVDELKHPVTL